MTEAENPAVVIVPPVTDTVELQRIEVQDLAKKTAYIEAERLAIKKKELEEIEARIDKKIANFKAFVNDTEIAGKGLAGAVLEEKPDDKQKADINKMLESTGLKI